MISSLKSAELMDTQVHKNIAAIPIKTPKSYKFDILTLKKGFELDLVEIKECETSTVNTLVVANHAVTPLLLVDGEEIVGGDQNRIVNTTILIAPESEMKIPVNCTEHGRWGFKHEFRQSKYIANHRTRRMKAYAIHEDRDVQSDVWNSIDDLEDRVEFSSPTQAMSESYENKKKDLNEILKSFEAVDDQNGILIINNGKIEGFEILFNPEIYREYHEKILKSYLIDAEISDEVFTINMDAAKEFIDNVSEIPFTEKPATGLEKNFEIKDDDGLGTAYLYQDEIIHMSYFIGEDPKTDKMPHGDETANIDIII